MLVGAYESVCEVKACWLCKLVRLFLVLGVKDGGIGDCALCAGMQVSTRDPHTPFVWAPRLSKRAEG